MPDFTTLIHDYWPVLVAYVTGATPFGFMAGKFKGIDIREHGSGNIGATNVLRVLGKPISIAVLVLDIFKGLIPVLIAKMVSDSSLIHIATAMAAILGHNYTFWLGFKGGKGIATTGGAMLPVMPIAFVAAILGWVIALKISRYVSVASITAALIIPITLVIEGLITGIWEWNILAFGIFVCVLAIWKHRSNIGRLRRGEENRVDKKSSTPETPENS